ncbi:MAG: HDOD domain-containing protein [Gammaproteobacteria bacterium]
MVTCPDSELLAYVDKMPAFPKSVQRIVQLTSDFNASAKEVVQVIECDPVMTVKILQVINSPYYGFSQKVSSIQRAVVHIGINTIKNMALSIAAIGMLKTENKAGFNNQNFLLHSLTTAIISKMLAERQGLAQQECSDFFVAGLLHDFGKLIFAEYLPGSFKKALSLSREQNLPLYQSEIECIGLSHAHLGKLLAEKWEFSQSLADAIAHHHDTSGDGNNTLTDFIIAANEISKTLHLGDAGNPVIEPFSEALAKRLGGSLDSLIPKLGDLTSIKAEALALIRS